MPFSTQSGWSVGSGKFVIAPSTIPGAGNGLFAAVDLTPGDKIPYGGDTVYVAAGSKWLFGDEYPPPGPDTGYMLRYYDAESNTTYLANAEEPPIRPEGRAANSITTSEELDLVNLAPAVEDGTLYMQVTKPVLKGTELLVNYGAYKGFGTLELAPDDPENESFDEGRRLVQMHLGAGSSWRAAFCDALLLSDAKGRQKGRRRLSGV